MCLGGGGIHGFTKGQKWEILKDSRFWDAHIFEVPAVSRFLH